MSRQNLTQRLRRDNFPEQDMRILAALLGYQVSIQLEPTDGKVPELFPAALAAQEQAQATPSAEALEEAVSDINENSLDHALETSTRSPLMITPLPPVRQKLQSPPMHTRPSRFPMHSGAPVRLVRSIL